MQFFFFLGGGGGEYKVHYGKWASGVWSSTCDSNELMLRQPYLKESNICFYSKRVKYNRPCHGF